MKVFFSLTRGTKSIHRSIDDKSYSSMALNMSEIPEGYADIAVSSTQCWFAQGKDDDFVEALNKEFSDESVTFNISTLGDDFILDIIAD